MSIIAVGDLHQLPPIQQKPIFCKFSNDVYNLSHPWHEFKMIELVEIMRQKDDQPFVELLKGNFGAKIRILQKKGQTSLLQIFLPLLPSLTN